MDEMYEVLLKIAGFIGAITAIIVFLIKAGQFIKKFTGFFPEMQEGVSRLEAEQQRQAIKIDNIDKVVSQLKEHDTENYLHYLQLVIASEELPLSERIQAGEKYIQLGGNGAAKIKLELIKEKYKNEVNKNG